MSAKQALATAKLNIQYVNINSLQPAIYNPRVWSEQEKTTLKESILKYGLIDPVLVNSAPKRKGILIGGHMRVACAKELGITEIPVVFVNIPDIKKEKALNLTLNRAHGSWNFELLKEFDIEMLLDAGFDDIDLGSIWDDSLETEDDGFNEEKELAKIKKPTVKLGEMYRLGNHVLLCGDSTDQETVKRLVGKNRIDMIYTDPPYNISLDYSKGISTSGKYGGKTNDKQSPANYRSFLKQVMENSLAVAKPDTHVFFWCDEANIGLIQGLYAELGISNKRVCLWIKNNFNMTPQIAFNKAYEPCVYGTRGKPYLAPKIQNLNELLNKEIGSGNRAIDDIVDLFNIWLVKRLPAQEYEHPTSKNPTLHEKAIRRCTKPGDTILDLCGGSGSTLSCCEQMKRMAFLCEIEPIFCDLIIRRYENLTKNKAVRIN
jgi:DNA modification methylase